MRLIAHRVMISNIHLVPLTNSFLERYQFKPIKLHPGVPFFFIRKSRNAEQKRKTFGISCRAINTFDQMSAWYLKKTKTKKDVLSWPPHKWFILHKDRGWTKHRLQVQDDKCCRQDMSDVVRQIAVRKTERWHRWQPSHWLVSEAGNRARLHSQTAACGCKTMHL